MDTELCRALEVRVTGFVDGELATGRTAIGFILIPIITGLGRLDDAVAAERHRSAVGIRETRIRTGTEHGDAARPRAGGMNARAVGIHRALIRTLSRNSDACVVSADAVRDAALVWHQQTANIRARSGNTCARIARTFEMEICACLRIVAEVHPRTVDQCAGAGTRACKMLGTSAVTRVEDARIGAGAGNLNAARIGTVGMDREAGSIAVTCVGTGPWDLHAEMCLAGGMTLRTCGIATTDVRSVAQYKSASTVETLDVLSGAARLAALLTPTTAPASATPLRSITSRTPTGTATSIAAL